MPRVEPLYYYKWFWKDWRSNRSVQRMHYISRGLYRELLDEQFAEGFIPVELKAIAEICGCPLAVMKEYWPEIEPHFVSDGRGGLIHPKMESVRTDKDAERVQNSKAGKATKKPVTPAQMVLNTQNCSVQPEEKSRDKEEQSTQPRAREPAPPIAPMNLLNPLANPEIAGMVDRIAILHPRNQCRSMQANEVPDAHRLAIIKAMKDEMALTDQSAGVCLDMMLTRIAQQAADTPPDRWRYFKEVPNYFALHEYRLESSHFNREEPHAQSRTAANISERHRARAIRQGRRHTA